MAIPVKTGSLSLQLCVHTQHSSNKTGNEYRPASGPIDRVPTVQGEWRKKILCQGKHKEFRNVAKTQRILYALIVKLNPLNLEIKDIAIFSAKFLIFFLEPERKACT